MKVENVLWHVCETGNHQRIIVDDNSGDNIAVVYDSENADILAAAPELAFALKQLFAICLSRGERLELDDRGPVLDRARDILDRLGIQYESQY